MSGSLEERFAGLHRLLEWQQSTPVTATRLPAALRRLESELRGIGNPIVDHLRPGLSPEKVRSRMAAFGLTAPADLITWFGWHDGIDEPALLAALTPYARVSTFDELAEFYTQSYLRADFLPPGSERWFPVVHFQADWQIMMDCGHDPATAGMVAGLSHFEFRPEKYHATTLAEPIEWWVEFIESGLWRYDPALRAMRPGYDRISGDGFIPERINRSDLL